ncbi:MAG: hypothetical protein ACPH66_07590, partial [Candidatus Puniceispirillaceae bacterium]
MGPQHMDMMPPDCMGGMSPDHMDMMPPHCMGGMGSEHMANMPPDCMGGMGPDHMAMMPPDTMGAMSPDQMAQLPPDVVPPPGAAGDGWGAGADDGGIAAFGGSAGGLPPVNDPMGMPGDPAAGGGAPFDPAVDAAVNAIDETAAAGMGDGMADMPADGTDDASGAGSDPEPTDVV